MKTLQYYGHVKDFNDLLLLNGSYVVYFDKTTKNAPDIYKWGTLINYSLKAQSNRYILQLFFPDDIDSSKITYRTIYGNYANMKPWRYIQ